MEEWSELDGIQMKVKFYNEVFLPHYLNTMKIPFVTSFSSTSTVKFV